MRKPTLVLLPPVLFILTLFTLINSTIILRAEGIKQLAPNDDDRLFLYTNVELFGNFAQYGGADDQRLYIHIREPANELIYIGLSLAYNSGHHPCEGFAIDAYFRIVDPSGTVVFPNRGNPAGQLIDSTTANITDRLQAINGPNQIVGTGGYDAFVFDPVGFPAGDYYIEFSRNERTASPDEFTAFEWWDITVASKGDTPTAIDGRVFSKNWSLMSPSISCGQDPVFDWFDRPFNGSFFVYTDLGMVAKTDFNGSGFQSAAFNVFFNDFGTRNTGNVIEDRKSLPNERTLEAQHRIFLNDPDILSYPSGKLGQFDLLPVFLECEDGAGCVRTSITEPGQFDVLIDIDNTNGDFIYDEGTRDRILAFQVDIAPGEASPYVRCVPWDGLDGFGNRVSEDDEINILVRYAQGIFHFPIYDGEFFLTGFTPTTIRPLSNIGSPRRIYYDDSNIPFAPGTDEPPSETFNSCPTPCHTWNNKEHGNLNTINTWFFAREESRTELMVEDCPIDAFNDTSLTVINIPIDIPILENDRGGAEINRDVINFGNLMPENGTVTFDLAEGDVNYTPDFAFIGNDTFNYVICLDIIPVDALCDTALVFIEVLPEDAENCTNGIDDDGDGLPDCDDPDCLLAQPQGIMRKKGEE